MHLPPPDLARNMPPPRCVNTVNILIADDHAATRGGMQEMLGQALPSARFGNAANAAEVMHRLSETTYDLILLDINMPGQNGIEALRRIKRQFPALPVVIVSIQPEEQYKQPCLRLGAAEYINKDAAPEKLIPTVLRVLEKHSQAVPL